MPRKTRRSPESPSSLSPSIGGRGADRGGAGEGFRRASWPGYVLTALLAAALGSGGTYLALRPALTARQSPPVLGAGDALSAQAALQAGNSAFDRKDWPAAIAGYTQAIAGGIDTPDVRTDLGTAYRGAGQPQKALEQYALAQKENPRHENSLFNQGVVYAMDLNDAPRAIAAWKQYLQRFPQGRHVAEARHLVTELQAHASPP